MRIVYLHQYFKKPSDFGSSRTFEMARRIAERGHEIHVVSGSSVHDTRVTEGVENFTVHWLPVPYSNEMQIKDRLKAFVDFALQASIWGFRLRPDVVFATSTPLTIVLPGIVSALRPRVPLVFEVRDLWPEVPIAMGALKNPGMKWLACALEKVAYSAARSIVALSPDMKKGIVKRGISPEKVVVIPNASDNELFSGWEDAGRSFRQEHSWLQDRPLVLYSGTMGHVNDVRFLVRMAARSLEIDPQVRFLVVGSGNEENLVRQEAEALGVLNNNFFMLEPVAKSAVPVLFAAADVSTSTVAPLPVLAANSANKVFDSFAAGTPVMINHEGWLAELLRQEGAGLVVSSTDVARAADDLVEFLRDSDRVRSAAAAAKALAVDQFDRQLLADRLASVLEGSVSRSVDLEQAEAQHR